MPTHPRWLEDRMRRAVRHVLKTHTITAVEQVNDVVRYTVHAGRKAYDVRVSDGWRHAPSCTCPDMRRAGDDAGNGFCKHGIAVLLHEPQHRHQLIDLLL